MLLLPKQRIRRYQITFIIVVTTTLSSIFLLVYFQPTIQNIRESSPSQAEFSEDNNILAGFPAILDFIKIVSMLIFGIGIVILIGMLFLWMPTLTELTKSKMLWVRKGIVFPERILSLLDEEVKIHIRRKRSSFLGWMMREFTMEIYLSKTKSNIKEITDFIGIEKVIHTPSHNILVKTVKLEHIPLQVIQIRSLLYHKQSTLQIDPI